MKEEEYQFEEIEEELDSFVVDSGDDDEAQPIKTLPSRRFLNDKIVTDEELKLFDYSEKVQL